MASLGCFVLKLSGYLVPQRWFEHPKVSAVAGYLPVALLAALVTTQTLTGSAGAITLDARAAAAVVAVIALLLRANFVVVVVAAAATGAVLRLFGVP